VFNILLVGNGAWSQIYKSTIQKSFPNISLTTANRQTWKSHINNKPDAVIVCTPPSSHIEIAAYALEKSIPVMCEKPLCLSLKEAEILKQYSAPILINYIHLFSKQYQQVKFDLNNHNINYIRSFGQGDKPERVGYNDLWDYAPHDIAMILDLARQYPKSTKCELISPRKYGIVLEFSDFVSHSVIGFGAKKRSLIVSSNYNILEYSDRFPSSDLPLTNAIQVFIGALNGKKDYRLGLDLSFDVLRVLEECERSLAVK
jgi:hypothetical protein